MIFQPQGGTGGREWWIGALRSGSGLGDAGSFAFWDQTASATRLSITGTGFVGIGITNPSHFVHVKRYANGDPWALFVETNNTTQYKGAILGEASGNAETRGVVGSITAAVTTTGACAVQAYAQATTGEIYGLYAGNNSAGNNAKGVYSIAAGATGIIYGVWGEARSSNASSCGVYGCSTSSGIGGYFTSTSGYALITGTGNVGIGASSPSSKLEVAGNVTSKNSGNVSMKVSTIDTGVSEIEIGGSGTGNRYSYIDFVSDGTYTDYGLRVIRANTGPNAVSEILHRGTGNLRIGGQDASAVEILTGNTGRVFVTSDGNVGIGVASPASGYRVDIDGKMHLNRQIVIENSVVEAGFVCGHSMLIYGPLCSSKKAFLAIRSESTEGPYIYFSENNVAERGVIGYAAGSGDLQYRTGATNLTDGTERLRVTSGGLVGIGLSPAAELLEVNGAIKIGTASGTANGTIRWTGTDFEGRKGGAWVSLTGVSADHGALSGLSDDDHTQYALLAGRVGNQTLIGGTAAAGTLTLQSTSNVTRGKVLLGTSAYDEVNNRLGVGVSSPATDVEVYGTGGGTRIRLNDTSVGLSALTRLMYGLELCSGGMNTSSKYTPAIKFMSTDSNFTTENPKFLAAIVGRATETYAADTDGGMALDFCTTPNDPGATSVPTVSMTLTQEGRLGIGTSSPNSVVHIEASDPTLRLVDSDDTGASVGSLRLQSTFGTGDSAYIQKYASTDKDSIFYFDIILQASTPPSANNATFYFFRNTNTTGSRRALFFAGDGSTTSVAQISCDGTNNTYFCANSLGGNLGVGTGTPTSARLQVSAVTDGQHGVFASNSNTTTDYAGVYGQATGAGVVQGVRGIISSAALAGSSGVRGICQSNTVSYGVSGALDSSVLSDGAAALRGLCSGVTGETYGCYSVTVSTTEDAAGAYGYASGTTGVVYGVRGRVVSSDTSSAPLYGEVRQATTNIVRDSVKMRHTCTAAMVDGFGVSAAFVHRDTSGVDNYVARISTIRTGADNSADLTFLTSNAGSLTEKARITKDGAWKLTPTSTPGSPTEGYIYPNSTDHKLYFYNGTSWLDLTATGSGTPGGLNGYVQFNSGGTAFGGDSGLFWDNTNKRLGVGTTSPSAVIQASYSGSNSAIIGVNDTATTTPVIWGYSTAATGESYGIHGAVASTTNASTGVKGVASGATGITYGVFGQCNSTTSGSAGVYGSHQGASGDTRGVYGLAASSSTSAVGVYGTCNAGRGVEGSTSTGYAVYGSSSSTGVGGYFSTSSASNTALQTGTGLVQFGGNLGVHVAPVSNKGINFQKQVGALTAHYYGIWCGVSADTAEAYNRTGIYTVVSTTHTTGTLSEIVGHNIILETILGGSATSSTGLQISRSLSNGGTIGTSYGINIGSLSNTLSTVTTNYGIYIGNQSGGTTNYAIYTGTGQVRFGDDLRLVGNLGVGAAPVSSIGIKTDKTSLGAISADYCSMYNNLSCTAAEAFSRYNINSYISASHTTGTLTGVVNAFLRADISGSGGTTSTVSNLTLYRTMSNGSVTDSYGIKIENFLPSGGACTNAYGIRIGQQSATYTTNTYGIYVDNQAGGTLSYALKTGTGLVEFGDKVGIGGSPSYKLHVKGSGVDGGFAYFQSTDNTNGISVRGVNGPSSNDTAYVLVSDSSYQAYMSLVGTNAAGSGNVGDLRFVVGSTEVVRLSRTAYTMWVGGNIINECSGDDQGYEGRSGSTVVYSLTRETDDLKASAYSGFQVWTNAQSGVGSGSKQLHITYDGKVGLSGVTPSAYFHAYCPNTTNVSLTWGTASGQILRNENSEIAIGLEDTSPYPLYLQGRTSSNTARDIVLNPLGGNIGIGTSGALGSSLHVVSAGAGIYSETTSTTAYQYAVCGETKGNGEVYGILGKCSSTNTSSKAGQFQHSGAGLGIYVAASSNYGIYCTTTYASGYSATFLNAGSNANRYGIAISCGPDITAGSGTSGDARWIALQDSAYENIAYIDYSTSSPYARFASASDARRKDNIRPTQINALDLLCRLPMRAFEWKDNKLPPQSIGYVAQEVMDVIPELVSHDKDRDEYLVGDSILVKYLVKAVQELAQKVKDLEALVQK
jgi:hypothetical protein